MTNQNRYIFTTTLPLATKFGRIVTWLKGLLLIKSYDPLITESCKIIWKTKVISLQPMITKLGSMMTYLHCHETLSLSTWSCKPMWQTEIISPLWLPMPAKLGRVLTYFKGIQTIKSHGSWVTWSCKISLKTFYVHYHSVYCHQTWQDDDLPWGVLTLKSHELLIMWYSKLKLYRGKLKLYLH